MVTLGPGGGLNVTSPPSDSRFSLSPVQPAWGPGLAVAEESPPSSDLPHQRCVSWAGDRGELGVLRVILYPALLTDLSHKHFHVVVLLM